MLSSVVFFFANGKGKKYKLQMQETSLSAVCETVLDRCLAPSTLGGEGCDNMTMILVQFKKQNSQNKEANGTEQSAGGAAKTETG
jgi:protein phosphatase 1G